MFTIDLDVGGTFTDGFISDGEDYRTAKVPTTPHDVSECVLNCVSAGAAAFGVDLHGLLTQASVFRVSTTIGTNLIVQGRGARVGLIVSKGAEANLYGDTAAVALEKGYISPQMIKGIQDKPALDDEEVLAAVRELIHRGARIIGVCLRDAWRDDIHEIRIREIVHARYPVHYLRSVPLQLSTEVSPATDDHARANSLILNALLHREMTRSLYELEDRLRDAGYRWPLLVTHSSGGTARVAKTVAAETLHSGPAAAVLGAWQIAQMIEAPQVVAADMGGTSLDIAFSSAEHPPWNPRPRVDGVQIAIPMLGVESIGAGGGSIARITPAGILTVGPDSAGADPGPACYARGGELPTVTDADLLLGYIGPDQALAGSMPLEIQSAQRAIADWIANPRNQSVEIAALNIRDVVDREMAAAIGRGIEGRNLRSHEVTLLGFGGAGPLHAVSIAGHAGINRVVAFPFGSVFSAYGSSTTNIAHLYRRTHGISVTDPSLEASVRHATGVMRETATVDMRGEGFGVAALQFAGMVELRANGQSELVPFTDPDQVSSAIAEARTAFANNSDPVGIEATWLVSTASVPHWTPTLANAVSPSRPKPDAQRIVTWSSAEGGVPTATYRLSSLTPGSIVSGPCIIDAPDTGYVIPGGWEANVDRHGFLVIEVKADD